ncbi:ORF D110 [Sulfolobus virus Ragged Hills]|uniref:ORF D110 n=1 Tax=Sulfolobus virus Ragged Hills TaxID=256994 RepID=Q6TRV2_9VIRU|nr:ORF D110 [Sulfolobus virus Ragged Hills]AAR27909.1 ORF D110 [Sulfolobus virus Ragged Hills]
MLTQLYFSESKLMVNSVFKLLTLRQKLPKNPESQITLNSYYLLTFQKSIPPQTLTKIKSVNTLLTLFPLILLTIPILFRRLSQFSVFTLFLTQLVLVKVSEVRKNGRSFR